MNILLKIEIAVILLLLLSTVFIRIGLTDNSDQALQQPQETTASTADTTPDITPETSLSTQPAETEPPIQLTFGEDFTLESRDYFVYDCNEENMMAISGDPGQKIYPASITKLFTAWVALQVLDPDTVVTLGREVYMVSADSSLAYVKPGQTISVAELVEGLLLPSGNDAAYGLAVAAARAESGTGMEPQAALEYFVAMMNEAAADQGMTGSHFTNPDGYHDPDHYTSCADLVTIARLAVEDPVILACTGTALDQVTFSNGEIANWDNTNQLIDPESQYYHPDALGLKTGHTAAAGFCLLSAFRLEEDVIIIGSFACQRPEDRFIDTLKLYDLVVDAKTE